MLGSFLMQLAGLCLQLYHRKTLPRLLSKEFSIIFRTVFFHCMKSVRNRSYSCPCFSAFGINTDQNNSEYRHVIRSVQSNFKRLFIYTWFIFYREDEQELIGELEKILWNQLMECRLIGSSCVSVVCTKTTKISEEILKKYKLYSKQLF